VLLEMMSVVLVIYGGRGGYYRAHANDRRLGALLTTDPGLGDVT
jgi:hypothetical protein